MRSDSWPRSEIPLSRPIRWGTAYVSLGKRMVAQMAARHGPPIFGCFRSTSGLFTA